MSFVYLDKKYLFEKLSMLIAEDRLAHSVAVADMAEKLAQYWNVDTNSAYIAGLLHDAAKAQNPDLLIEKGAQLEEIYEDVYSEYHGIWHALVGPVVLENDFAISNEEILAAVKWHSTGRAQMTRLEQILFLADYIEPNRFFNDVPFIRELAFKNIDEACFALSQSLIYNLVSRCLKIHFYSLECRNYYLNLISECRALELTKILIKCLKK